MDMTKPARSELMYASHRRHQASPAVSSLGKPDPLVSQAIANVAPAWLEDDPVLARRRTDAIYAELRRLDLEQQLAAAPSDPGNAPAAATAGELTETVDKTVVPLPLPVW